MTSKIIVLSIGGFILIALLIAADEILDIPALVFNTPPTPVNWIEIGIEIFFILMVGVFTVFYISKLDLERKRAEEKLRQQNELLNTVLESLTQPFYVIDANDYIIKLANSATKAGSLINKTCYALIYGRSQPCEGEDHPCPLEEVKKTKKPVTVEHTHYDKDGNPRNIEVHAYPIFDTEDNVNELIEYCLDITETKQMQEKLVRQEKLAILGQLAGSISHELRNPLGVIKNAVYFLNAALEEPEPEVKETLELLDEEVATSEHIISSLLDFARPKSPTPRSVDIDDIIQGALSYITIPENIHVVNQLDKSLPAIPADPDQLVQVFGNIILNAIQAMPEGGQLVIKSEVLSPQWVATSFTDTGAGIPRENLDKLFEPLFSTKAQGIGLGLAITNTLAKEHGGTIEVQSKVGKGSTFTVKLPLSAKEEGA